MADKDKNGVRGKLSRGFASKRDSNTVPAAPENITTEELVDLATGVKAEDAKPVVPEEPICDMFLSQEANPMIITPPVSYEVKEPTEDLLVMTDSERDELIERIEKRAEKLEGLAWKNLEVQLAWLMADRNVQRRVRALLDDPEDDVMDGETSGTRILNQLPAGVTDTSRIHNMLRKVLDLAAAENLSAIGELGTLSSEQMIKMLTGGRRKE